MSQTNLIFGFGSLINTDSLRRTAPNVSDIRPAIVKGFRREFNLWDSISGWREEHLKGIPYCALDIRNDSDEQAKVNGVVFAVDEDELSSLIKREREYRLVETTAYDFKTDEPIGTCMLFSACKDNGKYAHGSPTQIKYLGVCLEGAKRYGEEFYKTFLETTFIGNQRLSELPEIIKSFE